MPQLNSNDIALEYETFGQPENPAILLVMGLGCQLIHWPRSLCELLSAEGYFVIRFDNRDCGLSTHFDQAEPPNLLWTALKARLQLRAKLPYQLSDMMMDAVGLLDGLGIQCAHWVGASMGGMIAQLAAIEQPERVLSLSSIMSTTSHRRLPGPSRKTLDAIRSQAPFPTSPEDQIAQALKAWQTLMSPAYPTADDDLRRLVAAAISRGYSPAGKERQLAAAMVTPDRRKALRQLTVPTLVLHGRDDPLIPVACGIDTAKHIPDAELNIIDGMGHDFPEALMPQFAAAIVRTLQRCQTDTVLRAASA